MLAQQEKDMLCRFATVSLATALWLASAATGVRAHLMLSQPGNVRSTNPRLAVALVDGITRSETLRSLVATLDASDVIVYLRDGKCVGPAEACLMIVKTGGDTRHIHINFRVAQTRPGAFLAFQDRLIAQIGHELQHAVEVANSRDVTDAESLSVLYDRIGERRGSSDGIRYETAAAIQAGERVLREIHHRRQPR